MVDGALDRLDIALSDRYTIERELGSGGMATVYLAEDRKLHRKVALKVLRPALASVLGPDRFLQEIDIAAQLNHPHILGLFDCGEADGFLYYVMPYVEGQSLRDKLAKEGELPIGDVVRILRDVADALSHAHKHGVVHRDVKPDNVMLTARHALVADFGVAKAVSEAASPQRLTTEGVALGTPAYMAPEQAAADPHVDHRADIYSLGVVAYEMLTGRTPFVANTQQEFLAAHVVQTPDPVTRHRASVPPALAALVMKCLEKKPADRWQTADELLPHLEALATLSGGVTSTATVPVPVAASRRRAIASAVIVIAAMVAIVGTALLARRQSGNTGVPPAVDPSDGRPGIAVLPCENISPNPDDAYLAAGIHEEILLRLSKISSLLSIGRQSVERYGEISQSVSEIAADLGVNFIGVCSVRKDPRREVIRLTFQLLDTSGVQMWAENYDRDLSAGNLFEIESDVAQRVASSLNTVLTPEEQRRVEARGTSSLEAYEHYLLGRQSLNTSVEVGINDAIRHFNEALRIDPAYAQGHAGLAEAYASLGYFNTLPPEEAWPQARSSAERALSIDEGLGGAHTTLARVKAWYDWDWSGAEQEFRRAVELEPSAATPRLWFALFLSCMGLHGEANAQATEATLLDPLSVLAKHVRAGALFYSGARSEARRYAAEASGSQPNEPLFHWWLAATSASEGRYQEALSAIGTQIRLIGEDVSDELGLQGYLYGRMGQVAEAEGVLRRMSDRSASGVYVSPVAISWVYIGLGEYERALEWLDRGYRTKANWMPFINVHFFFDSLRGRPGFDRLVSRMGLERQGA